MFGFGKKAREEKEDKEVERNLNICVAMCLEEIKVNSQLSEDEIKMKWSNKTGLPSILFDTYLALEISRRAHPF